MLEHVVQILNVDAGLRGLQLDTFCVAAKHSLVKCLELSIALVLFELGPELLDDLLEFLVEFDLMIFVLHSPPDLFLGLLNNQLQFLDLITQEFDVHFQFRAVVIPLVVSVVEVRLLGLLCLAIRWFIK